MKLINNCITKKLGKVYNKAFKPYTIQESIHITQEDIDKDLHEGRE
jgi:hypothetical protein